MGHRTKQHTQITAVSQYSGPLPRPEDLIRYNDAVPGAAERILAMAEREMNHRHESERKILKTEYDCQYYPPYCLSSAYLSCQYWLGIHYM